jgi:hypothetical protein
MSGLSGRLACLVGAGLWRLVLRGLHCQAAPLLEEGHGVARHCQRRYIHTH